MARIGLETGPEALQTATGTVPAPNKDLWRLNMLSNCCEFFPVVSGLSHEPNTSDGTRIRLRTGEKQTPNCVCAL